MQTIFYFLMKGMNTHMQRARWSNMVYTVMALLIGEEVLFDSYQTCSRSKQPLSNLRMDTWRFWDHALRRFARIKPINLDNANLFCIKQRRYLGSSFSIDDIIIRRLDPILELHLNNRLIVQMLQEENNVIRLALHLLMEANRCFPALAEYVGRPEFERAKILYGVTFIHRGIERFGFQILPIPNKFLRSFLGWYLRNIFAAFNPNAKSLLKTRPQIFVPMRIAMSKDQLIYHFGVDLNRQ